MNRLRRTALIAAVALLVTALPAAAQTEAYGSDPLELIAYLDQVRSYASGTDSWEVIVCDVPDGSIDVSPAQAAAIFTDQLTPYFQWLSAGAYVPVFRAGRTVAATTGSGWPDDPLLRQFECEQRARSSASGTAEGALVIVGTDYGGGYGTIGGTCVPVSSCPSTFPSNGRIVVVGAGTVVAGGSIPTARLSTVAHEIGHAIAWPHSFGGSNVFWEDLVDEYDNPMDVMSAGDLVGLTVGTLAINRYAAGWLGPDRAVFHRGGTITYQLSPPGLGGPSFLVFPTDTVGVFEVLAPRIRSGFDSGVPAEGIEVYKVDQRGSVCGLSTEAVCWGADRRTQQVPVGTGREATDHVFGAGAAFDVRGVAVQVLGKEGDRFTVQVSGATVSERFIDDNGNPHEQDISFIAERGITVGCNVPLVSRYCPSQSVTRAEMALFILRAIGDPGIPVGGGPAFTDVPGGAWYADAVHRLAELGISTGYPDGTYRPSGLVSRGEMAVFLTRAFASLTAVEAPSGVFADVPPTAYFAGAVEGIHGAGVTLGCSTSPLSYCPFGAVPRDQMASFLARSLTG